MAYNIESWRMVFPSVPLPSLIRNIPHIVVNLPCIYSFSLQESKLTLHILNSQIQTRIWRYQVPRDDQRHQAIGSQYKRWLKVIKKKQEEEIAVSFVEEEVVQQETTLLPSSALKQPSSMRRQKLFQFLSFICKQNPRKAVWCLKPEVQFLPNFPVSHLQKRKIEH